MAQIGKIEHFQIGEDWESYEERLQQYFKASRITNEEKQVAVFLTVIGSQLYKLLRNLVSPSKPAEKTYEQLTSCSDKAASGSQTNSHSRKAEVS